MITEDVYDKIGKAESKKDANKIYLNHLKNTGTHEVLGVFCKVLRNTSKAYHIHEVIAARLENDTNLWVKHNYIVPAAHVYRYINFLLSAHVYSMRKLGNTRP